MVAYSKDSSEKFSTSKDAADYIKENKLDTLTIVGETDFLVSPIASYLDTKIYYPQLKKYGSFCVWSKQRDNDINLPGLFKSVDSIMTLGNKARVCLVLSTMPQMTIDGKTDILSHGLLKRDIRLELLKRFESGAVEDEKYNIYIFQRFDTTKENYSKYPMLM